jgi:hypothetical protein
MSDFETAILGLKEQRMFGRFSKGRIQNQLSQGGSVAGKMPLAFSADSGVSGEFHEACLR